MKAKPYKNPESPAWEAKANRLARSAVLIYECQKCWEPYVDGYRCDSCGNLMPSWTVEQETEWNKRYANKG